MDWVDGLFRMDPSESLDTCRSTADMQWKKIAGIARLTG